MYEYRTLTLEQRAELVRQRLARGYPPHRPPHPIQDRLFYLLTAACYEHRCHIRTEERRKELLDRLFRNFIEVGIELRGWVILPNHYHVLVYLGGNEDRNLPAQMIKPYQQLERAVKQIHGSLSRLWNLEEGVQGRKIWYAYSDRAIRSERHYYTTLNYIHYNPVKHRWVSSPYDWFCSSVHWYLEAKGREWLRDGWIRYPVKGYGGNWDDFCVPGN